MRVFIFLSFFQWLYTLSERKWNLFLRSHVNKKLVLRIGCGIEIMSIFLYGPMMMG